MKLLPIGVGLLVGPLALMLIVVAEVTAAVLSYVKTSSRRQEPRGNQLIQEPVAVGIAGRKAA